MRRGGVHSKLAPAQMNYEAMLHRAAEDRRMYELEQRRFQEARWAQQQRVEQQRQQYLNERLGHQEWRGGGDTFTRLHQEQSAQQQSHRHPGGWHGEVQQYDNWQWDGWQGGAQGQGAARDQGLRTRVLKKQRTVKTENSCEPPSAAPGTSDVEKTCREGVDTSGVNKEGSRPGGVSENSRKEKTEECSEIRKGKDCSEVRAEKDSSEVSSEVGAADGEAAGRQVENTSSAPVGDLLIPSDMSRHEESCKHLVKILSKGPSYLLNEVSSKELIAVQRSSRNLGELIDRSCQNAVRRELRSLAAEKEEISRQRDADRLAMESEVSKLKQDQEADLLGVKQAHETALSRHKQEQENLRKQLDKEQHKAICKICLAKPRDAVLLPCMHFDYCGQCLVVHQNNHNTCPSCRCPIQGVLNCNLGV